MRSPRASPTCRPSTAGRARRTASPSTSPSAKPRKSATGTLRDHAFTVTGGDLKRAKRKVQGQQPELDHPRRAAGVGRRHCHPSRVGRTCTATGAVCTSDSRQLANSPKRHHQRARGTVDRRRHGQREQRQRTQLRGQPRPRLDPDRHRRLRNLRWHGDRGAGLHGHLGDAHVQPRATPQSRSTSRCSTTPSTTVARR